MLFEPSPEHTRKIERANPRQLEGACTFVPQTERVVHVEFDVEDYLIDLRIRYTVEIFAAEYLSKGPPHIIHGGPVFDGGDIDIYIGVMSKGSEWGCMELSGFYSQWSRG